MKFRQKTLTLATRDPVEIVDLTEEVRSFARDCGMTNGLITVASHHTTLGVAVNERCEHLQKDMLDFLRKLAPPQDGYRHDRVASDGRPNSHSHLLSLVIPSQVTLVLKDGDVQLGTWQSVFAVELDGPRPARSVHVTAMGD